MDLGVANASNSGHLWHLWTVHVVISYRLHSCLWMFIYYVYMYCISYMMRLQSWCLTVSSLIFSGEVAINPAKQCLPHPFKWQDEIMDLDASTAAWNIYFRAVMPPMITEYCQKQGCHVFTNLKTREIDWERWYNWRRNPNCSYSTNLAATVILMNTYNHERNITLDKWDFSFCASGRGLIRHL